MRGTVGVSERRCAAFQGTVGDWTTCTIHAARPTPCRRFTPSYEDGKRHQRCDLAREAHGLLPLTPEVWEAWRREEAPTPLEAPTRLSRSVIWDLHRTFYRQMGPRAWQEGIVPTDVSTNPRVADAYAHLVVTFLRDAHRKRALDSSEPVYVLELGSGSGRLAFYLARALEGLEDALPAGVPPVCVVVTDFADANLEWVASRPAMQPLIEASRVDLAWFDADEPGPLELRVSGRVLEPGALANPVVVVANYVLDSLKTDAYHLVGGRALDVLVAAARQPGTSDDSPRLEPYTLLKEEQPADDAPYGDPVLDGLLEEYRSGLVDTGVWLPVGAVGAVRYLDTLSARQTLLLVGDKCFRTLQEMERRVVAQIATHGSLSVTLNLHAIERAVAARDGFTLYNDSPDLSFLFSAFVFPGRREDFPELTLAFHGHLDGFGPRAAHALSWALQDVKVSGLAALQILRATAWDWRTFVIYFPTILEALRRGSGQEDTRRQVLDALDRVAELDYPVLPRTGFARLLGLGYQAVGRPERAAWWYVQSIERDGSTAECWFDLGRCFEGRSPRRAREAYQRALDVDPGFRAARVRLDKLEVPLEETEP